MPFEIAAELLVRKPLRKNSLPVYVNENPEIFPSPDGTVAVIRSHDFEPRMGANCFLFTLVDRSGRILNNFEPLLGEGKRDSCSWSTDSSRFAIPVVFLRADAVFVYDLIRRRVTLIRFINTYQLTVTFSNSNTLGITFDDSQVPKETKFALGRNPEWPSDREVTSVAELVQVPYNVPSRKYRAPAALTFDLNQRTWLAWSDFSKAESVFGKEERINFCPIFEGFYPYSGTYPETTELIVEHLIDFAEYGDLQCQAWRDEIKRRTRGRYSRWEPASRYIGKRRRSIQPPARS